MLGHIDDDPSSFDSDSKNAPPETAPPLNAPPSNGESPLVNRSAEVHRSAVGLATRLNRGLSILKYYRKSQLLRRAVSTIKRKLGLGQNSKLLDNAQPIAGIASKTRAQKKFDTLRKIRASTAYKTPAAIRQQLTNGYVRVLNEEHPLNWRINKDKTLLWQFQLHYHEFLLPLAKGLDTQADAQFDLELINSTINSWLDANPVSDPESHVDAWHPYCISRRLPVWFCLLTLEDLNEATREKMLHSAHSQADFLSKNLEWDLGGNHLLENLRALALAGCFFKTKSSARWLKQAQEILPNQIAEQVLSHGEHFERCPMYHCQILGNFLETIIVCQSINPKLADLLRPVASRMFGFCIEIVHPDGEIPLLGDSCFGEAPSVSCLEQLATAAEIDFTPTEQTDPDVTTVGPYWIFRDQNDFLIFDRGVAGAQALPAHAHCDLLTIEASRGGVRWIVDSGLYNYADDPMRWHCRSSLAHNVVCVEDQNQNDVWSKFRMGYRGWTSGLTHGREGDFCWAQASHNGFRRMGVVKIERLIGIEKSKFWYCLDRVSPTSKVVSGFVHIGCEVQVAKINEFQYQMKCGDQINQICFFGASGVKLIDGWYCPEFGQRRKNVVLEYQFFKQPETKPSARVAGWYMLPKTNQPDRINVLEVIPCDSEHKITLSSSTESDEDSASRGDIHCFNWKRT